MGAAAVPGPTPDDTPPGVAPLDAAAVRRAWPEVLSHTKERKKRTAALLVSATVRAVDGDTLVLSIGTAPLARMLSEQSNLDVIAEALHAVLGVRWRVRCEHGDGAPALRAAAPPLAPPAPPRRQVPPPAKRAPTPDNVEPLPPEPPDEDAPPDDDEEAMVAEAARPRAERPVVPPLPDGDGHGPEKAALDLLATQLGARAIERR